MQKYIAFKDPDITNAYNSIGFANMLHLVIRNLFGACGLCRIQLFISYIVEFSSRTTSGAASIFAEGSGAMEQ